MSARIVAYVITVVCLAAASLAAVWHLYPEVSAEGVGAALLLSSLGCYTSTAKYKIGPSSAGEVSFIPFMTAIVLYPSWVTVSMIGVAVAVAELRKKKARIKQSFNIAQFVFAACVSVVLYRQFGGNALFEDSRLVALPHLVATVSFMFVNSAAVAVAISLVERRSFVGVLLESNRQSYIYDAFAIPGVYGVARAYTDWGIWGLLLTVGLLYGVRLTYQAKLQLQNRNRELLETIVKMVDMRDCYTAGHSHRVATYARTIAQLCSMKPSEVERISRAALLHDIGKIDEKFHLILGKTGKLTDEEMRVMEEHPVKSAEVVSQNTDLEDVVADVLHHHENYDGTGYPARLAGERIPIGSRVIIIADSIDAMMTDRPYRKALGPVTVRKELERCMGTQFDPKLCKVILQPGVLDKVLRSVHNDESRPQIADIAVRVAPKARPVSAA